MAFPAHLRGSLLHASAALSLAAASCSSSPPPVSHIEDKARLDVPIAICRKPLSSSDMGDAGSPRPEVYWSVLVPSFHGGSPLPADATDCAGGRLGAAPGTAGPDMVDLQLSTNADGRQIVWLPVSHPAAGRGAGVLALVRPRTSDLDVYAIGPYEGSLHHSRFEIGLVGTSRVLVAHDDGCADAKVDMECESATRFYVIVGGTLALAGESPAERMKLGTVKGLGRVKYRMSTAPPAFEAGSIRIHETVQVKDANDEDVRKAEGDRIFDLSADGHLAPRQDSLWSKATTAQPERPAKTP
jgi:hypothetical protein